MVMSNTQSNPRRNGAAKDGVKASRGGRAKAAKNATSKPASPGNGHDKSAGAHRFPIEAFTDEEIFAQFGGGHRDHRGLLLPGPGHDKTDASMRLFIGRHFKNGFKTHSFAGDSYDICRAYVMNTLGLQSRKGKPLSADEEAERVKKDKEIDKEIEEERAQKFYKWSRRWKRACHVTKEDIDPKWVFWRGNTNCPALVNAYFNRRGVHILDYTVFRWKRGFRFKSGNYYPSSILARVVKWDWFAPTDEKVVGFHETFIDDFDGSKTTLGAGMDGYYGTKAPMEGGEDSGGGFLEHESRLSHCSNKGIIWLYPGDPPPRLDKNSAAMAAFFKGSRVDVIGLAEGIENALSLALLPEVGEGAAIVSFVTASNLDELPIPPYDVIYIAVDIEKSGVGKTKAEAFAERAAKAGKLVKLVYPAIPLDADGKADLNDVIKIDGFKSGEHYKIVDMFIQTPGDARTPGSGGGARVQFGDYVSYDDYEMNDHGLFLLLRNNQGDVYGKAHLSAAFKVIGQCRDVNSGGWGTLLEFKDPDGVEKREHFSNADMHNVADIVTGRLAAAGLLIQPHQKNLVRDYIGGVTVANRIRTVARTGWNDDCDVFVLPDETIGDVGGEQTLLVNVGAHPYAHAGTLEEWKADPAKIAEPHRLARLAISTMLSGPILNLVQGESGGLHYKGKSSTGKSSQHCAAASVWGKGEKNNGFVQSWHNTANAFEGVATMASDTGLVLDELSEANAADVGGVVYMLGNESGKGRMRADTSMRVPRNWRVAILSSGEKTIAQKIEENRGQKAPAGVEMRLVNVNADAGKINANTGKSLGAFDNIDGYANGSELADALKKASVTHYGVAGPAFVRAIVEHGVDKVRVMAEGMIAAFLKAHTQEKDTGQVMRVARRFAIISTAGELAIEFGVLPWPKGHAESAASWAFKRWVKETGAAEGVIEDKQAIEHIRYLIEEYGDSRFDDIYVRSDSPRPAPANDPNDPDAVIDGGETPLHGQSDEDRPVFTRYGYRRGKGKDRVWLVSPQVWREVFCKGFDPVHVASLLAKQGKLKKRGKNLVNRFQINGQEHPGYLLNSHIFEDGDDANEAEIAA
jgi:uncharacterized protein (DUF927 family)